MQPLCKKKRSHHSPSRLDADSHSLLMACISCLSSTCCVRTLATLWLPWEHTAWYNSNVLVWKLSSKKHIVLWFTKMFCMNNDIVMLLLFQKMKQNKLQSKTIFWWRKKNLFLQRQYFLKETELIFAKCQWFPSSPKHNRNYLQLKSIMEKP